MGKHTKVSSSTKWRSGGNVNALLQLLVLICLCVTISHLFICLPNLELTTFKQHGRSPKIGYANALSLGTNSCLKKKERDHF